MAYDSKEMVCLSHTNMYIHNYTYMYIQTYIITNHDMPRFYPDQLVLNLQKVRPFIYALSS